MVSNTVIGPVLITHLNGSLVCCEDYMNSRLHSILRYQEKKNREDPTRDPSLTIIVKPMIIDEIVQGLVDIERNCMLCGHGLLYHLLRGAFSIFVHLLLKQEVQRWSS